jgi:hypothetical protein
MSVAATLGTDVPGGSIQAEQKFFRAYGTLAFTGSYATGGDAVSFASLLPIAKGASPVFVEINGIAGYYYQYVKAAGKIIIWGPGSATQLAAGAYPGGITGDTVSFEAVFPKV